MVVVVVVVTVVVVVVTVVLAGDDSMRGDLKHEALKLLLRLRQAFVIGFYAVLGLRRPRLFRITNTM